MKKLLLASLMLATTGAFGQTKKVLLEDYTGDWCQYCPNGTQGIIDMEGTYPTTFLPVAVHGSNSDPLEVADGMITKTAMNVTGVPNGSIDRMQFSGQPKVPIGISTGAAAWKTVVAQRVTAPALVSVSFANTKLSADGTTYEADIKVKFTAAPVAGKSINVNVMILENKIPAEVANNLAQTNSTTNWGGANPITTSGHGYYHDHTLRQMLGGAWGWSGVVPATVVVGTEYVKHISFTIPATAQPAAWVKANLDLYATVAYQSPLTGTSGTSALGSDREVINTEKMRLKDGFFKVGINETPAGSVINNTYPNPARVNDIISTVYTLNENAPVSLKVINMAGQVVAIPMNNSNEVTGTHTFQWRASENNLPAGNYILQLTAGSASHTQKITIQ